MKELVLYFNLKKIIGLADRYVLKIIVVILSILSVSFYLMFYFNGLGLSYNDARSHLDIGRRVVEGLKPGLAQIGSVWLPMNHFLMVPTIWNDFMWHSGLSGALQSMISYVAMGVLIYHFLRKLNVGMLGRITGVFIFAVNLNVAYLQSTAMTELLLIAAMTACVYYLFDWVREDRILDLIKCAFWAMFSTLVRYDGWFLLVFCAGVILLISLKRRGRHVSEGLMILFGTLGFVGIAGWFLWNQLIFKDALYFALGPFSAHAQQEQLSAAGVLATKWNFWLSLKTYLYALFYNSNSFLTLLAAGGLIVFWLDSKIEGKIKIASTTLLAPFIFNVLALFMGFSVLYVQGIFGSSWFNVRYGVMLLPAIAIFIGYLIDRLINLRLLMLSLIGFLTLFSYTSFDAVTIDDARVGSSQKNVSEVSGYLSKHATFQDGYILISAASHDAIIFSSGLPMKRFIHEGTGNYWSWATDSPDRWVKWIVMRTYDDNDLTYRSVKKSEGFKKYKLVANYPFADVYELEAQYWGGLND